MGKIYLFLFFRFLNLHRALANVGVTKKLEKSVTFFMKGSLHGKRLRYLDISCRCAHMLIFIYI